MRRVREGVAVARNPMNPKQERRVSLRPEDVGAIVFWTKNPAPLLPHLFFRIVQTGEQNNQKSHVIVQRHPCRKTVPAV